MEKINLPRPRQTLKMEKMRQCSKNANYYFSCFRFGAAQGGNFRCQILYYFFIHTLKEFMGTCEKYNSFINLTLIKITLIKLLKFLLVLKLV